MGRIGRRLGQIASLAALALLTPACRTPSPQPEGPPPDPIEGEEPQAASEARPITTQEAIDTGIMLRSPEDRRWGAHLRIPVSVGLTEFSLSSISLDSLSTFSIVPTGEFLVPLGERWFLMPFAGIGGAVQLGDSDLVAGDKGVWLATVGLRAQMWRAFAQRYGVSLSTEARYDAALTSRNGLLGDWGSVDAAVEVRRAFGAPRENPRFQGGLYVQGFHYWDPIELEISGVTPAFLENQVEFGISLGSTRTKKVLGIALPRTFIGVRFGEDLRGLRIRFGRL